MRKLWLFALVLAMLGGAIGCDSGGDEDTGPTDAEVFVGNWRLTQLVLTGPDGSQDVTALLLTLAGITVDIDFESSTFAIDVNMTDSMSTFAGTYNVNETQKTVTLTSSDFTAPVTIQYMIDSNNQITLETADVALFIDLTGFDPTTLGQVDSITLVIQRTG